MIYFDTAYLLEEPGWEPVRALARGGERIACSVHGRQREIEARLREEYALGAAESASVSRGFAAIDAEDWPAW